MKCPKCGNEGLIDRKDLVTGDVISKCPCGYSLISVSSQDVLNCQENPKISMTSGMNVEVKRSGKLQNKPVKQSEGALSRDDLDNPGKPVWKTLFKHREQNGGTSILQIVNYGEGFLDGPLKHIHDKSKDCDNEWRVGNSRKVDDFFDVTSIRTGKIVCNKCHRIFDFKGMG